MTKKESLSQFPLVSIIIPCFNTEKYIYECVQSVVSQDYENIEIIVIDDGSTDSSISILKQFKGIRIFTQPNSGACVARNLGISKSNGKYIKFLDSDDYLEPNVLSEQVACAEKADSNSIIYGNYNILKHNKGNLQSTYIKSDNQLSSLLIKDILISTPLHRKWMLDKVGGFDERLKNGQEWNLHVRLASHGFNFVHHDLAIFTYRIHNSSSRISNSRSNNITRLHYSLQKTEMTIEKLGMHLDSNFYSALSMRYLWIARGFLREGEFIEARKLYNYAKSLTDQYKLYWPNYYKALYRFLGFYLSEIPLTLAIKLRSKRYKM